MPVFHKWFDRLPQSVTVQTALRTLWGQRFEALCHYLNRLKSEKTPSVETVHQLRVWARRTTAVVDLFAPQDKDGPWQKLRKSLKKIRRWAGDVRDYDVLWDRLRNVRPPVDEDLRSTWKRRRRTARKNLAEQVEVKSLLQHGPRILRQSFKEILVLYEPKRDTSFGLLVRQKLRANVRAWSKQAAADLTDPAQLHAFRIEGKRLRYALEISTSVLPQDLVRQAYEKLNVLHLELGEICDIRAAIERFEELREEVPTSLRKILSALVQKERRTLVNKQRKFLKQWTPEIRQTWQAEFRKLLK